MQPCKFSDIEQEKLPYHYPNLWHIEQTTGPERIVLAPSAHQIDLLLELTRQLPEPFFVLYILLVPRDEHNEPGRYQNVTPCSRKELEAFLTTFRSYFEGDGRFHLWTFSLPSRAQLIYDNHNVLYGYGPLDEFASVAKAKGLIQGEVTFPDPHAHHYNAEFDADAQRVMKYWEWIYSPLKDSD